MIKETEIEFANKLLAALKLNECTQLNIDSETIIKFMEKLENIIRNYYSPDFDDYYSCNSSEMISLLTTLFFNEKKGTYEYSKLYKIINKIDPLVAEKNEDKLYIILNDSMAEIILKDTDNSFNKMAEMICSFIEINKEKVKVYENYE